MIIRNDKEYKDYEARVEKLIERGTELGDMELLSPEEKAEFTMLSEALDEYSSVFHAYGMLLDKLEAYKAYPLGWDGEGAVPLTSQVVSNFNQMLEAIDKQLLTGLTIFPETNGTLLIEFIGKEAGVSLGNDKFSYYEIKDGQITGENGIVFSVQTITKVIEKILESRT